MPSKKRRRYDSSIKLEALRLANDPDKSDAEVERELGLFGGAIKDWRKQLRSHGEDAFPGSGHQTLLEEENRRLRHELEIAREERDILKKSHRHLLKETEAKFRFMKSYRNVFSVERIATVLGVSRSGYYAWLSCPESQGKKQQRALDTRVRVCFKPSKDRSGSPKVYYCFKQQGFGCSRPSVARSMRRQGLRAKTRRRFIVTTDSEHTLATAPNLLKQRFDVDRPNTAWVSDITYLWSREGWLYLTVFLDLFSRRIVGWALSKDLGHDSALSALESAVHTRQPGPGLVIHKDRGTQFCCEGFRKAIQRHRFIQSMSR